MESLNLGQIAVLGYFALAQSVNLPLLRGFRLPVLLTDSLGQEAVRLGRQREHRNASVPNPLSSPVRWPWTDAVT